MIRNVVRAAVLLSLVNSGVIKAQNPGVAPESKLDVIDPYATFGLPALKDAPGGPLSAAGDTVQVWTRARKLGVSARDPIEAWIAAEALLQTRQRQVRGTRVPTHVFEGSTASALNRVLSQGDVRHVQVKSSALTVDQPLLLARNGVTLDLGDTRLVSATRQPYMIRIERVSRSIVRGGNFLAGDSAILVNNAENVTIEDTRMSGLSGNGIVVTESRGIQIVRNVMDGLGAAPILLHRGSAHCLVQLNRITGTLHASNMSAGIVISDREVDLSSNSRAIYGPDGYWVVSQPIVMRLNPPHDNLLAENHVARHLSSGIYVDGGIRNVIAGNTIQDNAKEGVCLDNGATANVLSSNLIRRNGNRWGQTDEALAKDFAAESGRLPDGTAARKVPGVSIDNAVYNLVFANQVSFNYGGGIKMVRTAFFNLIGMNTLLKNNEGASRAYHFFGIELGAAPGDSASDELDFLPSRGNVVFSNTIRGDHYAGIFFDLGSDQNEVFDNVILDASHWGLESIQPSANVTLNNLTNLPSRNIGSGLDPALLTIAAPQIIP